MKNFLSATTILECAKGVSLGEAIREAIMIALERDEIVSFTFNGIIYELNPEYIINFVTNSTKRRD